MKTTEKTLIDLALSYLYPLPGEAENRVKHMHLITCECYKDLRHTCTCPSVDRLKIETSFECASFEIILAATHALEQAIGGRPMAERRKSCDLTTVKGKKCSTKK
jgi:hypothetical protein